MRFRFSLLGCAVLIMTVCMAIPLRSQSADSTNKSLNRLFIDPETRARIDAVRKGDPANETSVQEQSAKKIQVNGVVIRENGENVIWINGESSLSNKQKGVTVRTRKIDRNSYRVPIQVDNKTVRLKPGQVWTGENGKIKDND